MKKKVIGLDTRAMRVIRESSSTIKSIARMINERGAELIEDDEVNKYNVLLLVNTQLQRLIDGTINNCMGCGEFISVDKLIENPLVMICHEECAEKAVRKAAESISRNLNIQISELNEQVKSNRLHKSPEGGRKGDPADRAIHQIPDVSESFLTEKRLRLTRIQDVMREKFSMHCKKQGCEEEIPLPARVESPEILFCRGCRSASK